MEGTPGRHNRSGIVFVVVFAAGLASLGTSEGCDGAGRDEAVEVDGSGPVELRYRAEGTEPSFPNVQVDDLPDDVALEVLLRREGGPGADGGMTVPPEEAEMTFAGRSEYERLELSKCESAACEQYDFVVVLRLASGDQATVDLRVNVENSKCTSNDSSLKITRLP